MAHLDLTLFLWEKVILKKRSRLWNPDSLNLNYSHLNSAIAKRVRFYQSYLFRRNVAPALKMGN